MAGEESGIPVRVVETESYINTIREMINEGHEVPLLITGNSMQPFLVHRRDTLLIKKPQMPLQKGDMVFYQRKNGQFVMHRIYRVRQTDCGEWMYYMVGDAQREIEGPIEEAMIFGHISRVRRKGRWIGKGDFWWEFFEHVWIRMIPFRRLIISIYGRMRRQ